VSLVPFTSVRAFAREPQSSMPVASSKRLERMAQTLPDGLV